MQPSPKGEIWRETWLKAERHLASWVPGRRTEKSHKPSIWFSMASLLFCADTQLVPPTVTHRTPERKHTEPRDMLENKKLPRVLFLKGGLRTAPTTEGWGWDWEMCVCTGLWAHRTTKGLAFSRLQDLLHRCGMEGPVSEVGSKHITQKLQYSVSTS